MRQKTDHLQSAFAQIGRRLREGFDADAAPLPKRLSDLLTKIEEAETRTEPPSMSR